MEGKMTVVTVESTGERSSSNQPSQIKSVGRTMQCQRQPKSWCLAGQPPETLTYMGPGCKTDCNIQAIVVGLMITSRGLRIETPALPERNESGAVSDRQIDVPQRKAPEKMPLSACNSSGDLVWVASQLMVSIKIVKAMTKVSQVVLVKSPPDGPKSKSLKSLPKTKPPAICTSEGTSIGLLEHA